MQETQRARLHRTAHEKRLLLDRVRHIGDQGLPHFAVAGAVQNQAKCALLVMLANQDNGPMEERAVQFAPIQQKPPFQGFMRVGHTRLISSALALRQ
jgi:hypothetical protein